MMARLNDLQHQEHRNGKINQLGEEPYFAG